MHVNTIISSKLEFKIKPDDNGEDSVSFFLYGPGMASINVGTGGETVAQNMIIQPGENIDCYIDTRITGFLAMSHRPGISRNDYNGMIHNGEYGKLDRLRAKNNKSYRLPLYRGYFGDYHMTGNEYMSMVKSIYDSCSDSINNSDTPQMLKELQLKELQTDVITALEQYARLLRFNYQRVNNGWEEVPEDSIKAILTNEDYEKVTTWFDMSDPRLLMCGNNTGNINWNEYGVNGDLWTSVRMFRTMAQKAKKRQLEQTDIDSLKTLSDKFYATACDSINRQSIREYQRRLQEQILTSTPDVPDDKVFDAIVEPHMGKIAVVDLWNTWCGPCRMALKNNEPLKQGDLNNEDIVWIYIADDTSDDMEYFNMIPNIKGVHYKVNEKQIKAISERFNVDGIPFYILIDREGNAERRLDLRDHNKYIEAIKSKL